jgi:UDP-N-acetylmuramoyl-L-alanyl-D-glutamate--2,6-diaminopimelate ligase
MGVVSKLRTKAGAHAAAASAGWPARKLEIIFITGQDGAQLSVAYLAAMLRRSGEKVGIITQRYVEIAGEQGSGSDQADVLGDIFRLQHLLQQMKKADCRYVVIELPAQLPAHRFAGITPSLLAVRRCGDRFLAGAAQAQRAAQLRRLIGLRPQSVVMNRDDPCFDLIKDSLRAGPHVMTFGTHVKADCKIKEVELHPKGSAAVLMIDNQTEVQLGTHLAGKQAIYSMATAAAAAYMLQVSITAIEDGALSVGPQLGCLEKVPAERPYQIIIDGSITPEGIAETLETLRHFSRNRVLAVVSANLAQDIAWRQVIGERVAELADRIIVCDGDFPPDKGPQAIRAQLLNGVLAAGAEARVEEVPDRQAAFEKVLSIARRNDILVIVSSPLRPYRQVGGERRAWSDRQVLESLLN